MQQKQRGRGSWWQLDTEAAPQRPRMSKKGLPGPALPCWLCHVMAAPRNGKMGHMCAERGTSPLKRAYTGLTNTSLTSISLKKKWKIIFNSLQAWCPLQLHTEGHHTHRKTKVLKLILCPAVPQPSMHSPPGEAPHFTIPKLHVTDPWIMCFLLPQAYSLCQCLWELLAQQSTFIFLHFKHLGHCKVLFNSV